jgi:hypothetical protein
MQADRQDRSSNAGADARSRHGTQALIMVVVAVILAGGALLMLPGETPDEATEVAPPPVVAAKPPQPDPAENIRQAPDIPEPEPEPVATAEPAPEPAPEPEPEPEPPTTEEIDERLRESLNSAGADDSGILASALAAPFMLDRGVSAIDQVARGYVPLRALNLPRPSGQYTVTREGQQRFVDESAYDRYDRLVDGITALNPAQLATAFQRHRELLAEGYAALGYPADAMDNAVIAALDAILATPVIRQPLELRTKGALYAYVDPDLESRSDLQKQLLRMGPDNLEVLQRWAQDLRTALLQ